MGSTATNVQYIMLADDDADDRLLFEEAIAELDVRVGFNMVKDGVELINYLTGGGFMMHQILFLDLNMPFKNGFQCLDEIRSMKTFQDLFIIIYSTTARAGDIDNQVYNAMFTYSLAGHALGVGYQQMRGDDGFT